MKVKNIWREKTNIKWSSYLEIKLNFLTTKVKNSRTEKTNIKDKYQLDYCDCFFITQSENDTVDLASPLFVWGLYWSMTSYACIWTVKCGCVPTLALFTYMYIELINLAKIDTFNYIDPLG